MLGEEVDQSRVGLVIYGSGREAHEQRATSNAFNTRAARSRNDAHIQSAAILGVRRERVAQRVGEPQSRPPVWRGATPNPELAPRLIPVLT